MNGYRLMPRSHGLALFAICLPVGVCGWRKRLPELPQVCCIATAADCSRIPATKLSLPRRRPVQPPFFVAQNSRRRGIMACSRRTFPREKSHLALNCHKIKSLDDDFVTNFRPKRLKKTSLSQIFWQIRASEYALITNITFGNQPSEWSSRRRK